MSMRAAALVGLLAGCAASPPSTPAPVRVTTRPRPPVAAQPAIVAAPPSAAATPAGPVRWTDYVPAYDLLTRANVRGLFERGATQGLRADVFAKLGDSITESGSFAQDLGHGWFELAEFTRFEPTIRWFSRRRLGGPDDNSFSRGSGAATAGWDTGQLLEGGDASPLERELTATRAAFAVLMIGTNDAERGGVAAFTPRFDDIVTRIVHRGVVPILSTVPPHDGDAAAAGEADAISARVRTVAAAWHLPLIDLRAAFERLPHRGLCDDGVHPSVFVDHGDTRAAVFTADGLRYGYNVRNLLLLFALMQAVEASGAASR